MSRISVATPAQGAPSLYGCVIPSDMVRRAAVDLCVYLCGGTLGAPVFYGPHRLTVSAKQRLAFGDPVYQWVTLNLQDDAKKQGWFFSSCGYLPLAMIELLGWWPTWGGRGTRAEPRKQPIQRIVSGSVSAECTEERPTFTSWALNPGDVLQLGNTNKTAHVNVVIEYDPAARLLRTADYGQPGGALRESKVAIARSGRGARLLIGERQLPLMHHLSLATLGLTSELAQIPEPVVDHWMATGAA